jgi:hypothetical protein
LLPCFSFVFPILPKVRPQARRYCVRAALANK